MTPARLQTRRPPASPGRSSQIRLSISRYDDENDAPASPLSLCAACLATAGERLVAAAAVLGEGDGACGGALSDAGPHLDAAAGGLDGADWECAADAIAAVAGCLREAGSATDGDAAAALVEAATQLEDASEVTGCISLAAAAGPNLQDAATGLDEVASAFGTRAEDLAGASTPAYEAASKAMREAAEAMMAAASSLREAGVQLENGTTSR